MILRRRDLLRASAATAALAGLGELPACRPVRRVARENGRIVVTFWYAFGDSVRKALLDLIATFNKAQTRVVVRAVHQGDYFEALAKLRTALAAGEPPSLAHVVLEVLPYLARAGVLEPLDEYDGARDIPFVPALTQEGAFRAPPGTPLVGIPFNRSTPIAYANARLLAAAGVAFPATWDELAAVAARLTRRGPGIETRWGFEVPISWWYWAAMVGQGGGALIAPSGRVTLGGDAGVDALRFWQRLVHVDRVMRPPPGRDYQAWQSTNDSFLRGRIATMWSSAAYIRYIEDNASFPVSAAPLPRQVRAAVPTGGTMLVVPRAAPADEKRAAWEFVRWICEAEQTATWAARTGYLPVTTAAVELLESRGFYARHPNDRVAYDELAYAEPWPWAPELFRLERDVVEPRLEDAVFSGSDARDVMREACEAARGPA